jgi:TPR repeat protein
LNRQHRWYGSPAQTEDGLAEKDRSQMHMTERAIPIASKNPWQIFLGAWRGDASFRGFFEFSVIGAVVLCFLHGLHLPGLNFLGPNSSAPAPRTADPAVQSNRPNSWTLPTVKEVMFDENYFSERSEPLRSKLTAATGAIKTGDTGSVDSLLADTDADDPSVQLIRGTIAVASPDPRIQAKGVELLRQSASQGDTSAKSVLGVVLLVGRAGQSRDVDLGRKYLQEAAEAGDGKAAFLLAEGFFTGWVGQVDPVRGAVLLRRAAEQGDAKAMFQYAITLIRGIGTAKNVADGEIWMLKAAELGHPGAQSEFGLARLADYNLQVTTDPGPAIKWLSRAAEQRDANAMYWLGAFYLMSKAYHAPERGAELFKKCSEETLDDRCTFAYATALETGQGVPIDLVRAAAFYRLANEAKPAQGKLERLAVVEKQLSVSEVKSVREIARQIREQFFATNRLTISKGSSSVPSTY